LLADQIKLVRSRFNVDSNDLSTVRREIEQASAKGQEKQFYLRLLDADGRTMAESRAMSAELPPEAFPQLGDVVKAGRDYRATSGRFFRLLTARFVQGSSLAPYVIQSAMDRTMEMELLAEYRRNLWIVIGLSTIVSLTLGFQIAYRGMRPVRDIARTASRIRPSNLTERISLRRLPGELVVVATTFNEMLDRLQRSFQQLSQLSADLAHELRTPLNNLRGGLEVALGKPRSAEEYRDAISSSLEECHRLSRMIDSLLFLARAENPQTLIQRESIDVGSELNKIVEFFEVAANDRGVRLQVALQSTAAAIVDRALFQRAVGNLFSNALEHTPEGGLVTLNALQSEEGTRIDVTDTGCGIPDAQLPQVCDRFFRGDPARRSDNGHLGLGLAIVRSIVELHGGRIDIKSKISEGTQVSLFFPRI